MKHSTLPLIGLLLLGAFLAGGCAKSVSFESWRNDVDAYVREKGGGDPAVLRTLDASPSHRGFRVISKARPTESTDVVGVLIGSARAAGRPWTVFLVGLVDESKVEDIRLAALSIQNGRHTWRWGIEDDSAVEAYTDYNKRLARRRFPDRRKPPPGYLAFPREDDRFELATESASLGVTHPPSGAKWHVNLNPPQRK